MSDSKRVKITAVVMTFNEEKRIQNCLESVISVVDEIVIVDSYSTDTTEEKCLKYGVKFIQNKFDGYIEQRQFAISRATNDYILVLDADEILSSSLQKAIKEVKNNWKADAYIFNRLTNYGGKWIKHCGWYPDKKIRLFDRNKIKIKGKNPHDQIVAKDRAKSIWIKKDILHYSYTSVGNHIEKTNSFSKIAAISAYEEGKRSTVIFHIILKPTYQFIEEYIFKLGFLEGYYGFVICSISAFGKFLKFVKLHELHKNQWK